jgi:hypothetical protein
LFMSKHFWSNLFFCSMIGLLEIKFHNLLWFLFLWLSQFHDSYHIFDELIQWLNFFLLILFFNVIVQFFQHLIGYELYFVICFSFFY